MKRKKLSQKNQLAVAAYERAAGRIEMGQSFFACTALDMATLDMATQEKCRESFEAWFKPNGYYLFCAWWPASTMELNKKHQFAERTMRILALLLMAELVRDGQIDFD